MSDTIRLNSITIDAICGVLPQEQANKQPFEITLCLTADLSKAGKSDDLKDTVDYGQICDLVDNIAKKEKFQLLERFSQYIVEEVFKLDSRIEKVQISVKKLKPPVDVHIGSTEVRITRSKL